MDNRQTWLIVGAVILGLAVVGGVMAAAGAPPEVWGVFLAPAALVINPFFLIILIIVLAARRNRQQQQQQVVVITGPPPGAAVPAGGPRLRCPKCQGLSKADARFCGGCGIQFG